MSQNKIQARVIAFGDTAANLTSANPLLALKEFGVETDTHARGGGGRRGGFEGRSEWANQGG